MAVVSDGDSKRQRIAARFRLPQQFLGEAKVQLEQAVVETWGDRLSDSWGDRLARVRSSEEYWRLRNNEQRAADERQRAMQIMREFLAHQAAAKATIFQVTGIDSLLLHKDAAIARTVGWEQALVSCAPIVAPPAEKPEPAKKEFSFDHAPKRTALAADEATEAAGRALARSRGGSASKWRPGYANLYL